jgi:hypothetical protein
MPPGEHGTVTAAPGLSRVAPTSRSSSARRSPAGPAASGRHLGGSGAQAYVPTLGDYVQIVGQTGC